MAKSIPYLRRADNGVFYLHWTENRIGKRETTKTRDADRAAKYMATWIFKSDGERPPRQRQSPWPQREKRRNEIGSRLALADVWDAYYKKRILVKAASVYSADTAWKQLQPFWASMPASALTQANVDKYITRRTRGRLGRRVKPQTCAKELSYLRAAVVFCADERRGLISPAFVHKLELPPSGAPRERWLRPEEIAQLLAGASTFYNGTRVFSSGPRNNGTRTFSNGGKLGRGEIFIWLALYTAGREQALLELTWDRVDFEIGVIDLAVPGRKQTKKRRAAVPISDSLRPILERAHRERINDRVLMHGGAIWPTVQSIVVHAGLAPRQKVATSKKPKATGISPHVFRHSAATHMARSGVPIFTIAKILGNSIKVVEEAYAKYNPADARDAVNLISGKPKNG